MLTLLAIVHVMIGLSLILFVLLQDPKGGAMGVFSGGSSSNTFFGSSGASNFLTATTKWLAVLFAASCLTLTYISSKQGGHSVMDNLPANAPSLPANGPANGPADGASTAPSTPAVAPGGVTTPAAAPAAGSAAPLPADSKK